jgi:ABC-2 type transport system ATP-binding protein
MTQARASTMVEARKLRKLYGNIPAVEQMSFEVSPGEVVGFLGPNGAGKSTTMKMLTGFLRPSEGASIVGGIDVSVDPLGAQRKIGYLPESAPMYDDMMVIDFVRYIAQLRGLSGAQLDERLKKVLGRCGLMKVLGKDIGQLSKGFRQRVGLAQAIIHDPDLLILDEPTSGLDPNQIVEIRELIKDLGQEKTVILSTHILPEVQATCGRIMIINEGKLVADDTPDTLTESESGSLVNIVVKANNTNPLDREKIESVFSNLPGVQGVQLGDGEGGGTLGFCLRSISGEDPREAIFSAAVAHDVVLLDMHREKMSLEETFRRLTSIKQGGSQHA